jgi:hypothetical protein
VRIGSSLSLK